MRLRQRDALGIYLSEIGDAPLLTAEEERELGERSLAGDEAAREQLVVRNLPLAVHAAKAYRGRGLDLVDLVAEANIGLIRAAEKFDPAEGCKFSTYATYWIRDAIGRALVAGRPIRLPDYLNTLMGRWRKAEDRLRGELGRRPEFEEVAGALRLRRGRYDRARDMVRLRGVAVLSATDSDGEVAFAWMADARPGPGEEVAAAEEREAIGAAVRAGLEALDDRERAILRLRYGFDDGSTRTLREAGRAFGLSAERVRQIEGLALGKLREALGVA